MQVDFHVSASGTASKFAYDTEIIHEALAAEIGTIDLFLAGPPCQGYSNLYNKTRRENQRNQLHLMATLFLQ